MQDGNVLEAKWNPGLTYVVRIRDAGAAVWSLRFKSPLTHFSFSDRKPDTEYEVQVRARNASGEGEPRLIRVQTGPTGHAGNVIPFSKR